METLALGVVALTGYILASNRKVEDETPVEVPTNLQPLSQNLYQFNPTFSQSELDAVANESQMQQVSLKRVTSELPFGNAYQSWADTMDMTTRPLSELTPAADPNMNANVRKIEQPHGDASLAQSYRLDKFQGQFTSDVSVDGNVKDGVLAEMPAGDLKAYPGFLQTAGANDIADRYQRAIAASRLNDLPYVLPVQQIQELPMDKDIRILPSTIDQTRSFANQKITTPLDMTVGKQPVNIAGSLGQLSANQSKQSNFNFQPYTWGQFDNTAADVGVETKVNYCRKSELESQKPQSNYNPFGDYGAGAQIQENAALQTQQVSVNGCKQYERTFPTESNQVVFEKPSNPAEFVLPARHQTDAMELGNLEANDIDVVKRPSAILDYDAIRQKMPVKPIGTDLWTGPALPNRGGNNTKVLVPEKNLKMDLIEKTRSRPGIAESIQKTAANKAMDLDSRIDGPELRSIIKNRTGIVTGRQKESNRDQCFTLDDSEQTSLPQPVARYDLTTLQGGNKAGLFQNDSESARLGLCATNVIRKVAKPLSPIPNFNPIARAPLQGKKAVECAYTDLKTENEVQYFPMSLPPKPIEVRDLQWAVPA